ncbi:hypothetical protein V6N13_001427 [Hibiscus sabdariffa]|uniref:Remorin C-terminal domain-containing protein n=1 Tax=Hibiscus sabdariffa TaxID=183260 RepID=A0ABR2G938_9ROSI
MPGGAQKLLMTGAKELLKLEHQPGTWQREKSAFPNLPKKLHPTYYFNQMKLEKKRSSSMDQIANKLRSAQKIAQEMRSSMVSHQAHEITRTSHEATSFCRTRQIGSLSGCFT